MSCEALVSRLAACAILALAVGCQRSDGASQEKPKIAQQIESAGQGDAASTGQEDLLLASDELAQQQGLALDGEAKAAAKVAQHYAERSISDGKYREDAKYWFAIAAENGDPSATLTHAQLTYEAGGWRNCRRAMFWLKRADALAENDEVRTSVKGWQQKIASDKETCTAAD